MKHLLTLCLLAALAMPAMAQNLKFIGRVNVGFGAQYESLDYSGDQVVYSPGGGMGLEAGLGYELIKRLDAYATLGFQKNLALQYESVNGTSNKTSASFGRGYFTAGLNKLFKTSDGVLNGIILGAGLNYNFPGKLKLTENSHDMGEWTYTNALGYQVEAKLRLKFTDTFSMDPGFRYRNIYFEYEPTANSAWPAPANMNRLNATGVDLSLTLVKRI
ncbi:outer membrane beta-barrel protein [Cesiribacter sp. SM1]|uniref:outer membrane beta-barrel protein n=1 Tax=Cesiribacter sp. SM1 TaxID=2861196 RepID=UPI001CD367F4|nr:outer membrane beta-barrel protein [Cesiribacter sp. SM1]